MVVSAASVALRATALALHIQHNSARSDRAEGGGQNEIYELPVAGRGGRWVDSLDAFGVSTLIAGYMSTLAQGGPTRRQLLAIRERDARSTRAAAIDTATVSRLLHVAGIDHLVVNGPALAIASGLAPGACSDGAVRVWVPTSDAAVARSVLESAGWTGRSEMPGLLSHRYRFPLVVVDVWGEGRGRGSARFSEALARSVPVPELGPSVRTVPAACALLAQAEQARSIAWCWMGVISNVAQLAAACSPGDLRAVQERRTARRALAAATHLAPWLSEVVEISRRDEFRARRAWDRWVHLPSPTCPSNSIRPQSHGLFPASQGTSDADPSLRHTAKRVRTG